MKNTVSTIAEMGLINQVDEFYFSALFDTDELLPISDEKYAEELALQEALFSSASNNLPIPRPNSYVKIKKEIKNEFKRMRGESSNSNSEKKLCNICMDMTSTDEMLENKGCNHSFCHDCLCRYIGTKLQENISAVKCPDTDCNRFLEPEHCQNIIPQEVFHRWGNALCESAILASQKFLYCPFKNCSSLIIDDGAEEVDQSECPSCHRLFCAKCKVAWHGGMSCDKFQSLGVDERGREDIMLMDVANKKQWRRCTNCKFFVEKIDGCNHVKCRCGFEFCYGCGKDWTLGAHTCIPL